MVPKLGTTPPVEKPIYPNGLDACMNRVGISSAELGRKLDPVSPRQTISKYRRCERQIPLNMAKKMASILGCSWQEIINGPIESETSEIDPDTTRADLTASHDQMDTESRVALVKIAKLLARKNPHSTKGTYRRLSSR